MARLLLLITLVLIARPAFAVETKVLRFLHEGVERRALMDAPRNASRAPVLVVLHGGIAGPETVRRRARVGLAREGWVVLWPSAIGDWNDGRVDRSGQPYDEADDIGFFRRMIDELAAAGKVDPSQVYFAGPSIGGVMVLRLLCDAPDLIAGAAVAIASLPEDGDCRPGAPRPILYIHGTDDDIMPPGGGRIGGWSPLIRDRGWVEPVDQTLARLEERNGCAGFRERPLPNRVEDDGSTVRLREYQDCAEPLLHYIIDGGGHTWPGSRAYSLGRGFIGETNQDISATREVERFFKALAARPAG